MTPPVSSAYTADAEVGADKELVLAFQRGESHVYDLIDERYRPRVEAVCRRILVNSSDAQEATQETFLRVYQALGRFNGRYQLGAWITRIATNVCLDHLRAQGRRPRDIAELEHLEHLPVESNGDIPEDAVLRKAEGRKVWKILASLPPLHRAAIVLRDYEGMSYDEIARVLKISEPQVKALLHRARKGFKRSWLSQVASALIPARWLHKIRAFETTSFEQAAQSGASSIHVVSSCSAFLQHCGQLVVDKVGPAVAALAIGVAAGTAGLNDASADRASVHRAAPDGSAKLSVSEVGLEVSRHATPDKKKKSKKEVSESVAPAPAPVAAEPSPSPTPEPSTSPTSEPDDRSNEQPKPDPEPRTQPSPPLFTAFLGMSGGAVHSSAPIEHTATVDCSPVNVSQSMETSFNEGDVTYPADFDLEIGDGTAAFDLVLYPDGDYGGSVRYEGTGQVTHEKPTEHGLELRFAGSFHNTDAPDAAQHGLPQQGAFALALQLDCAAASVVSETLQLSGQ